MSMLSNIGNSLRGLAPSNRGAAGSNTLNKATGGYSSGDIKPHNYRIGQLEQFTPEQNQLFQHLFSFLSPDSYLSKLAGGDESFFEEMEAPAWRKFGEAQGQLGSRFSEFAPGAMSAQRGSGFKNQAGQLGSDFAMDLSSKRRELQRQAIMDMMGLSNMLLSERPTERAFFEKQPHQMSTSSKFGLQGLKTAGDIASSAFG